MKKLIKFIGEYKKATFLTPMYVMLEVIMEVLIPYMMAKIIDVGIGGGNIRYIVIVGVLMVLMSMLSLFFGVMSGKYAAVASAGFSKNLRKEMYKNVQEFSFSNIDKFSTASLVTRLTTDVTNVQNAFQMIIRMLVRAPFMMISALILAFYINSEVSLIFLAIIPILALAIYFIMSKAHPAFERVFRKYDDVNASVQENLTGIRAVKAYVREQFEIKKFDKASDELYHNFMTAEKIMVFAMPVMQFAMYTSILLISWLGAKLIIVNSMTTGELMSLFNYAMQILMSLMMVSMVFVMITMAKSSAERIIEVIEEKSSLTNPEQPKTEVTDGSILFEHVYFSYSETQAEPNLTDINLKIESGETVGIIGGTGSAKTTLVQLIPRLYDAGEGRVLVGGTDVREYDIEALREQVAMVLQKNVLFSGTIKENLRWGNKEATDEELIHACQLAQADSFIREFPEQYNTYIEQGGTNVSGGQKQRLCIARALLKKPKILILDDSTSAVDTKTDAMIRKAFREQIPDTTKLIIAQRISSVQDADKIIVLLDGHINGIGTHEELLKKNEIYREVYESQTKGDE